MSNELQDFERFMQEREAAARAYVNGDPKPLDRIATRDHDATFFSPSGSFVDGAKSVATRYTKDAASFATGSDTHFEILQMAASDGIAYWVGFQRAMVNLRGKNEPVPFDLRVTEIYRREDDGWKMVHRHADALSTDETTQ